MRVHRLTRIIPSCEPARTTRYHTYKYLFSGREHRSDHPLIHVIHGPLSLQWINQVMSQGRSRYLHICPIPSCLFLLLELFRLDLRMRMGMDSSFGPKKCRRRISRI
jgi:hypothetical protein